MNKYITLNNERLNLNFTSQQKELIKTVYELFTEGSYSEMVNFVYSQEILKKLGAKYQQGGYWIDAQTRTNPLYKLVEDIEIRLAIQVGRLSKSPNTNTDFSENKKVLEDYLR
ncbi:hypothetical protein COV11_02980 [Candidatus Woesearchaeota archaeon CG10_big_fil_rev_8_21_14_0_10_30_7]|nr:MAG: hypothetical protein COV11_02980 [Candidatus Woesearchaeota archaeon CG10_big_fil_rev_8_21_14_0_10_30_7]